jgi:hypothetical protein
MVDGPAMDRCLSSKAVANVRLWHDSSDNAAEGGIWCGLPFSGVSFSSSDWRLISGDNVGCSWLPCLLA